MSSVQTLTADFYSPPSSRLEMIQEQLGVETPRWISFQGRLNRLRYNASIMTNFFIANIAYLLLYLPGRTPQFIESMGDGARLYYIMASVGVVALALIIAGLSYTVRRLHDIGLSGWWALLILIPGLSILVQIILGLIPGKTDANRFGRPNPRNILGTYAYFVLTIVAMIPTTVMVMMAKSNFTSLL